MLMIDLPFLFDLYIFLYDVSFYMVGFFSCFTLMYPLYYFFFFFFNVI